MSNKPNLSILEDQPDFGDSTLNAVFKDLDENIQKLIMEQDRKQTQIMSLKYIVANPTLKTFYEQLPESDKALINAKKKEYRFHHLRNMFEHSKLTKSLPKPAIEAKTPSTPPQSPSIAIIVPFRDLEPNKSRTKQLNQLVDYMESYLSGQKYKIIVVEQTDDRRKFNRGQLLNIGFEIAASQGFDVFIFHDVDLLPSPELKPYYVSVPLDKPVHIAAVWNRYNSNPSYFGGIVAFNRNMFRKINGYPNNFWGWGGEDDELMKRTKHFYNIMKPTVGKITDLENMNLTQKLDYLKTNELKFMRKREALEQHDATWKTNGLADLNYKDMGHRTCGSHCEVYVVELNSDMNELPMYEEGEALRVSQMAPNELFDAEPIDMREEPSNQKIPPPEAFNRLVRMYYDLNLYRVIPTQAYHEMEVRFGTRDLNGVKRLTKNDYDNVVKALKSFGFQTTNPTGTPSLRIRCEFLDSTTGRFKMSDVRTEIDGLIGIENYCKSNDIKAVYKQPGADVRFVNKRPFIRPDNKQFVRPVDMDDFNFRVSIQSEEMAKKGVETYILENWRKSKKEFRYLNRVTFEHPIYPVRVDLSITKSGNKGKDSRGRYSIIPVTTLEESNLFNNPESYEIEIEVINKRVGLGTTFSSADQLLVSLRKVIKLVLSGLQGTMYPVSYVEQQDIIRDYMKMIWGNEYEPARRVTSQNFIGPNSITLQLTNIAPIDENTTIPNIRKDFVVTDKADGERHLMFVSKTGKIYLITTNMDVKFTGAKTLNEECFNTLFDGELIAHDKNGEFINLYAAFDVYYHKGKDLRGYAFLMMPEETDVLKSRFYVLDRLRHMLKPVSILDTSAKPSDKLTTRASLDTYSKMEISPIRFMMKKFYPMSATESIFDGCRAILRKEQEGLFEYETDGLIFSHMYYGVGSSVLGKAGPKTKVTWDYSFKWKPPQFNTIDFLVTTLKTANGDDVIKSMYEDGISMADTVQYSEYKILELRCGFNEKYDGFINPCQDIIDDNLPEFKPRFEDKQANDYVPKRFYPTEPYDPNAGICHLMLKMDDSGAKQMFAENGEAITDNTIVEFAYDIDAATPGWNWKPLRVRHDKTAKLRRGEKEYGNSYRVCNENWKSIHPTGRITEEMLMTGLNIPDVTVSEDVYYNTPAGKMKTEALKNFHNLYVKKMLISGAAKQGDTLIDFACGKAGDLPKWIAAKLSFVFGVDYSEDNLENRLDGACVRYLKARKSNKHMLSAIFARGNSGLNIRDGSAMLNDKAKQITAAVFGQGPKDAERIGRGVAKQYGKGEAGFNVSSCQFAIHYFFETPDMLRGFLRNVAECTKLNGYFIGTSYDGKTMFQALKKVKTGESVQLMDDGKKVWEVIKEYTADTFEDNSSSIRYKINVYQESINRHIPEYLVNYEYFDRLMDAYGFKLIGREEANEMGLPAGSGMFSELFTHMLDDIQRNKGKKSQYGDAPNMSSVERKISFLNRYFVYKKIREVNLDKILLELGEYQEAQVEREKEDTQKAVSVAKETVSKPKVRKLSKKLLLVAATEAVDEAPPTKAIEETIQKKKEKKPTKAKKIIIENDEE